MPVRWFHSAPLPPAFMKMTGTQYFEYLSRRSARRKRFAQALKVQQLRHRVAFLERENAALESLLTRERNRIAAVLRAIECGGTLN